MLFAYIACTSTQKYLSASNMFSANLVYRSKDAKVLLENKKNIISNKMS